jgi:hypothetical protein
MGDKYSVVPLPDLTADIEELLFWSNKDILKLLKEMYE